MSDNMMRCDVCKKNHFEVSIIEKPFRFCVNSEIFDLPQINSDGRRQDNICLKCLADEIDLLREC